MWPFDISAADLAYIIASNCIRSNIRPALSVGTGFAPTFLSLFGQIFTGYFVQLLRFAVLPPLASGPSGHTCAGGFPNVHWLFSAMCLQ